MEPQKEKSPATVKGAVKLCEDCGEKPTLHPNSKLCAGCMARRSHKNKKRPESAFKASKKKSKGGTKRKAAKTFEDANVIIEFGEYAPVLKEIEKIADQEMRPLGLQIIYMLDRYLKSASKGEFNERKT